MSHEDNSQPPFPSGFGAEFDQAAWDHARAVGRAHAREFNRRADRRLAIMIAPLGVPAFTYCTYLMARESDWIWFAVFLVLTVVIAISLVGMYRGWGR